MYVHEKTISIYLHRPARAHIGCKRVEHRSSVRYIIYKYIYMYICIYIYVHIYIYIYIYMCVYVYI